VPDLLEPLRAAPERAGILTDFDGTLSAIVEDFTAARPLPGVRETLDDLAARYALVAVVSGRPVTFLREQLGTAPRLVGLYGLESIVDGTRRAAEGASTWRPVVQDAFSRAKALFGDLVENKGLSLTIHFRTRPEVERDVRAWAEEEHRASTLDLRAAKASVELHPPVEFDKGTVVDEAVEGLTSACFLGDDVGDLPAFAALDRLRAAGLHTVKIGVRTPEAPAALLDAADIVVDGPSGALELLRTL
jgi:trehalose 6-phosphate phosphatase